MLTLFLLPPTRCHPMPAGITFMGDSAAACSLNLAPYVLLVKCETNHGSFLLLGVGVLGSGSRTTGKSLALTWMIPTNLKVLHVTVTSIWTSQNLTKWGCMNLGSSRKSTSLRVRPCGLPNRWYPPALLQRTIRFQICTCCRWQLGLAALHHLR